MARVVLGLDIGGANLKAATADKRAVSVPFALWREPDALPRKLAELVGRFPDATEFAVTMTGELCDCYETKRQGVTAIVNAAVGAARSHPVRVWGTGGRFLSPDAAKAEPLTVAAANWHALATFVGGYASRGTALLVDIGSTTTDIIPILDGDPWTHGKTDPDRLRSRELVYTGVRRTPVCAVLRAGEIAAELFATTLDAYLLLGHTPENPDDRDTADGRPATKPFAHARLSRMLGGDPELTPADDTLRLATRVLDSQENLITNAVRAQIDRLPGLQESSLGFNRIAVVSGSGEFLARRVLDPFRGRFSDFISITERHGPALATCAPAYALAVLATERPG